MPRLNNWFAISKLVLAASLDTAARLWHVETGETICSFAGHTDCVASAVFSKEVGKVLTASFDNTAKLWNVETVALIRCFQGHTYGVMSEVFSHDDDQFLLHQRTEPQSLGMSTPERSFAPSTVVPTMSTQPYFPIMVDRFSLQQGTLQQGFG
eukprot:TRINITY_DN16103_c0_g1_i2.p2 TRINITY_DN16103_c0_g1~~TRINITY_DN16103_c0_g1_i2.p2  ORF type:complete len:153 (-),score=8.67 TRINITY_DN16103_c0_g1_i2:304-762(-)